MKTRMPHWAMGALAGVFLFAGVGVAHASSLSVLQIQAIVSLVQSFGADPAVVANVQATLNGQPTAALTQSSASCVDLPYNLSVGSINHGYSNDVSALQQFLDVNPTGYFGAL